MLLFQEIEQRRWGDLGGRGEGAVLQLPTDGVVHEGVTAGVPPGGGREAGEEEGSKDGNSGFSVVTFIVETLAQIYFCKADILCRLLRTSTNNGLNFFSFSYFEPADSNSLYLSFELSLVA